MTSQDFQNVIEMTRSPSWVVFVNFVAKKHQESIESVLMPIEQPSDVFACERAKGSEIVLKGLVEEFRSFVADAKVVESCHPFR